MAESGSSLKEAYTIGRVADISEKSEDISPDIDILLRQKRFQLILKRMFDAILSSFGILVLSPLLICVPVLIMIDSSGSPVFRQERVGRNGKRFKILKFRTMVRDAEKMGIQITVADDDRITCTGKFLRKSKIDELPQLFNVLIGDMSFVGPRPEVPRYADLYNKNQRNILKIRPGITDLASIEYRNENEILHLTDNPEETYIEKIMPAKIDLNLHYMEELSVFFDIKLIFMTLYEVVRRV